MTVQTKPTGPAREIPPEPASPGKLALWALAWLLIAAAGFVALSSAGRDANSGGQ